MQRIHSEKQGKSVSKDDKKVKRLSKTLLVKWESRVRVIGWWVGVGLLGLLERLCSWWSKVLGTIELRLWGVAEVWLSLLILKLNLLLLLQNSFLVLQERIVNENAVDEDLSSWFMISKEKSLREMIKEMGKKFSILLSSFHFFYWKLFLKIPKLCPYRNRGKCVRKMHREEKMFEREN